MTLRNAIARLRVEELVAPAESTRFITAKLFRATVGAPVETNVGSRFTGYGFPSGANQQENVTWDDSDLSVLGWVTFKIDLIHENPNATGGAVNLTLTSSTVGAGSNDTTGDTTLFPATNVTVGAQNIFTVTTLAASVTVAAGKLRHVRLLRTTGGGDTLAGTFNVLGYRLTKVT